MNEGLPQQESIPTKEEILGKLEREGLTDENRELVSRWTEAREREVTTAKDTVLLNIDRIDFYSAVGDKQGALECAVDAYLNAMQEGETELADRIAGLFPQVTE